MNVFNLQKSDLKKMRNGDNIENILKKGGAEINKIKKNVWDVNGKKLYKGTAIFKRFDKDLKKSPTSIAPLFTIVNEKAKVYTFIQVRTQTTSGSTDQKIPYSLFFKHDYIKMYGKYMDDFDVDVVYILDKKLSEDKYKNMIDFIKDKSIKVWINEFKI